MHLLTLVILAWIRACFAPSSSSIHTGTGVRLGDGNRMEVDFVRFHLDIDLLQQETEEETWVVDQNGGIMHIKVGAEPDLTREWRFAHER